MMVVVKTQFKCFQEHLWAVSVGEGIVAVTLGNRLTVGVNVVFSVNAFVVVFHKFGNNSINGSYFNSMAKLLSFQGLT